MAEISLSVLVSQYFEVRMHCHVKGGIIAM